MKQIFGFFAFLILVTCAFAQSNSGNIQGTVTDSSGAPLSGANVTGQNMDTGVTIATVTTDSGLYSLPNLPPGRYSVTVEAPGLKKYVREGVTVSTGTTVSLDMQMQLGAVTENVTVIADASQLETATSDIGATVERLVTHTFPLEQYGEAITAAHSDSALKVQIFPNGTEH